MRFIKEHEDFEKANGNLIRMLLKLGVHRPENHNYGFMAHYRFTYKYYKQYRDDLYLRIYTAMIIMNLCIVLFLHVYFNVGLIVFHTLEVLKILKSQKNE